jgi:predicted SAM-dependent methyltransferase
MFWQSNKQNKTNLAERHLEKQGMNIHLHMIHQARLRLVEKYLPKADVIVDLGGAGSPLYQLGYPYPFRKLTIVDLPADNRDEQYKQIVLPQEIADAGGEISIKYGSMIDLAGFEDNSVDLVWSGQSIEHISLAEGRAMCRNVLRILRKGGSFCLDTPNRYLTEIHTRPIGGGFINPDHKHEYYTDELKNLLKDSGFRIRTELGLCHMPFSREEISYADFIFSRSISRDLRNSYIQFYRCIK